MYAVGAHGSSDIPGNVKLSKKQQRQSPVHKRTRILFDDILANTAKRARKGQAKEGGRLLSRDGGGIKGLVLTRMLLSFEKIWETPVVHCFDWIAGNIFYRLQTYIYNFKPWATKHTIMSSELHESNLKH